MRPDNRSLALIAVLSALAAAARVPFAVVPGLQPSTFLILAAGAALGPGTGLAVGALTAFLSNLALGQGPWTFWQAAAWGGLGLAAGLLGRLPLLRRRPAFTAAAVLAGFLYGAALDLWFWAAYVRPLITATLLAAWVAGLPHDAVHALGNGLFAFAFGPAMIVMMERYGKRCSVEYID